MDFPRFAHCMRNSFLSPNLRQFAVRSVRSVEISKIASHGEQDEKPVLYADSLEA